MALSGLKVVEFAGLAPGPFAGLVLADNGASVTRVDRIASSSGDILCRGKRSISVNSKTTSGRELLKKLIAESDVLIDPFRPGVLERLGLGPDVFLGPGGVNERLVYARIAGFPPKGPHKDMAGHDINYLALSGVLSMLPGKEKPSFPLNLLADFGGGGMVCVLGILLALVERGKSGRGQIVEADMVSGTRYLSSFPLLHILDPQSQVFRGVKLLAGGAPFYDVYRCKDDKFVSVGCLEPQFFAAFITRFVKEVETGPSASGWAPSPETQSDLEQWSRMKEYFERGFKLHGRDHWARVFHGTDACVVPVLSPEEASDTSDSDTTIPQPHPNLSRTPSARPRHTAKLNSSLSITPGQHNVEVLRELGVSDQERQKLVEEGAIPSGRDAKL